MAIPDYQACMLPLLRFASDGKEHQLKDAADQLAKEFGLTAKELQEFLPSGQQPTFMNRIGWARTYLSKAGLLRSPSRILPQTRKGVSGNPETGIFTVGSRAFVRVLHLYIV